LRSRVAVTFCGALTSSARPMPRPRPSLTPRDPLRRCR
jgi:hypothetical protein